MIRAIPIAVLCSVLSVTSAFAQQMVGGCPVLPANNIWNTPVDTLPVLANSASMITTIGASRGFHADFGSGLWDGGPIGIPFITVPGSQQKYPATFEYSDESDPGPYAVPLTAPIEGGSDGTGDRHAIALDTTNCMLYELFYAFPGTGSWSAGSGAIYDLKSNALRPSGWTSADAAGLPIMPGLVTYDEVLSGEIKHAIRFTASQSRREYVWPARHFASSLTGTQYPRMGERFRLKASYDISGYPAQVQVILRAMKKYGIIMSDNGSSWFISGKPDERWNNDTLRSLSGLLGSNFEAVDATVLRIDPNSGEARQSGVSVTVSPSSAAVRVSHTRAFSATVTNGPQAVTWSVNDVVGGNATVGTIDNTGVYLAPSLAPSPSVVTVKATVTGGTASATASVTIVPLPSITSVTPNSIPVGNFTLTVSGAGFVDNSKVWFDGVQLATTVVSSTSLTATGNAPTAKPSVPVQVTTPDGENSNIVSVAVTAQAPISISISPTVASVKVKTTRQFVATVGGTSNTAVLWKVNGITGGNGTVGTISTAGLYKAPNSARVVTVSATSVADQTRSASATVTVTKR